jgi:hypothetical protein
MVVEKLCNTYFLRTGIYKKGPFQKNPQYLYLLTFTPYPSIPIPIIQPLTLPFTLNPSHLPPSTVPLPLYSNLHNSTPTMIIYILIYMFLNMSIYIIIYASKYQCSPNP